MADKDEARLLHASLYMELDGQMDSDDVKKFKHFCTNNPISPRELEKLNTGGDVLYKLEEKGKVEVGKYEWICKIFKLMDRVPLCDIVTSKQKKIQDLLGPNTSTGMSLFKNFHNFQCTRVNP